MAGNVTSYANIADFQATDPSGNGVTSSAGFTATINWGDGTSSPGQIVNGFDGIPWLFEINGTHAYPNPSNGEYNVQVELTDPDGGEWYADPSIATVDPRPNDLNANAVGTDSFSVTAGQPLTGEVAIITIPDPNLTVTGLTGQITNLTDGTTTTANIVPAGPGTWDIYDSENFNHPGTDTISIEIHDNQGDSTALKGQVTINAPPSSNPSNPGQTGQPSPGATGGTSKSHGNKGGPHQPTNKQHGRMGQTTKRNGCQGIPNAQQLAVQVFKGYNTGKPIQIARAMGQPNTYLVMLSGTEPFNLAQPTTLPQDLNAELGLPDAYFYSIQAAIRKYIPRGARIILAGHSLGGMEAENIVTDRSLLQRYRFTHVITFGSPRTLAPLNSNVIYTAFDLVGDPVPAIPLNQWPSGDVVPLSNRWSSDPSTFFGHLEYPSDAALSSYDPLGFLHGTHQLWIGKITQVKASVVPPDA